MASFGSCLTGIAAVVCVPIWMRVVPLSGPRQMGCNAWNHDIDCPCDFRGGHGFGGGYRGPRRFLTDTGEPTSFGWASDRAFGVVASYVNPNAHCPVCGKTVFFYRSPYNGRVFFDDLGPPWPKHGCTDNGREPRRATRASVSPENFRGFEPVWHRQGWEPLLAAKCYVHDDGVKLTGDIGNEFLELSLVDADTFDGDGPILARPSDNAPGFFEVAVLKSDHFGTRPEARIAHEAKLAPLGYEVLSRAAMNDAVAFAEVGRYMLYEVQDLANARVYLERAHAGGAPDVAVDLAVVALFPRSG